jgi:REP element-mobilizing transposase RayT
LADSLPAEAIARLRDDPRSRSRLEELLDSGAGACWLRDPRIADLVEASLLHFDGERYRLLAWCVMRNHVHVLVEPADGVRLGDIIGSWKRFTARKANERLGRSGPFWQDEYWDRYIRDGRHFAAAVSYIEQNPVKARLIAEAVAWPWGSARRRESHDASLE